MKKSTKFEENIGWPIGYGEYRFFEAVPNFFTILWVVWKGNLGSNAQEDQIANVRAPKWNARTDFPKIEIKYYLFLPTIRSRWRPVGDGQYRD